MDVLYADTSAVVKLVRSEPETAALVRWLSERRWVIGDLHRTELRRAARRAGPATERRAERLLGELDTITIDGSTFDRAGRMEPADLRSLDAIHLACALTLANDLSGIVSYDLRLIHAARNRQIAVWSPT